MIGSHSREFDFDPQSGIRRVFHWDEESQTFTIETIQDAQDVVEDNLFFANSDDNNSWADDLHRIASIPLNIYCQLKRDGIIDDPKRFRAWLNDSENRAFRTKLGRV